jgi:hypothetical protein
LDLIHQLVGVAVNVMEPPLHIEVVLDVMVTDGATKLGIALMV